jgi:hypothetical protein
MQTQEYGKTLLARIKFHQEELNKAVSELIALTGLRVDQMVEKYTTSIRAKILSTFEHNELLTAKEIRLRLGSRGELATNIDQALCGMENNKILGSNREKKRKRYYIIQP